MRVAFILPHNCTTKGSIHTITLMIFNSISKGMKLINDKIKDFSHPKHQNDMEWSFIILVTPGMTVWIYIEDRSLWPRL